MAGFQMPKAPPGAIAAFKEDLAAYKVDATMGDTDMQFDLWLKTQRPERYSTWLKMTEQGK